MVPLRILILSDGRPGHFNLSEGIAAAAGRMRGAEIQRIEVRRGRWPGALMAALTTGRLPAAAMLERVYGLPPRALPQVDLVISAGAETLAANVWASRVLGVPNVFYGSLRLFDPQDFSLVLTSYASKAARPRHAVALKPAPYDPDSLAGTGAKWTWPPATAALVLGGDAGRIRFADADWDRLLAFAADVFRTQGTRWRVANSRRTPVAVSDRIAHLAGDRQGAIAEFLDVRTAGPGTLTPLLGRCDFAVCTADSSSMVSECIWLRRPTLSVAPAQCPLPTDEKKYRDWLDEKGWCRHVAITDLSVETAEKALAGVAPLQHNPQAALARLLADRIPSLRRDKTDS